MSPSRKASASRKRGPPTRSRRRNSREEDDSPAKRIRVARKSPERPDSRVTLSERPTLTPVSPRRKIVLSEEDDVSPAPAPRHAVSSGTPEIQAAAVSLTGNHRRPVSPALRPGSEASHRPSQRGAPRQGNVAVAIMHRINRLEEGMQGIDSKVGALTVLMKSVSDSLAEGPRADIVRSRSCGGSEGTPAGRQVRSEGKPKDVFDDIMKKAVPHIEVVFGPAQIARCLYNTVITFISEASTDNGITPSQFDEILGAILFSLSKTDKKERYRDGCGPLTSKMRRRTLTMALLHAQRNTFNIFRPDSADKDHASEGEHEGDVPVQPEWLTKQGPGGKPFVESHHIEAAQKRHETSVGDKTAFHKRMKVVNGGRPTRDEEAEFAMGTGYSYLLAHLNNGRKYAPSEFWFVAGYLFMDWRLHRTVSVDGDKVRMSWLAPLTSAAAVSMSDISRTVPSSANDPDATEKNEALFKKFARSHEEISMIVEHDVLVNRHGREQTVRHRIGKDVRSWRRIVHLMDVAAHVLKSLCQFDKSVTIFHMLAYHKQSIAAIYAVARVLRMLFSTRNSRTVTEAGRRVESSDGANGNDDEAPLTVSDEDRPALDSIENRLSITRILGQRVLERALCRVPEDMFEAEHIAQERGHGRDQITGTLNTDDYRSPTGDDEVMLDLDDAEM